MLSGFIYAPVCSELMVKPDHRAEPASDRTALQSPVQLRSQQQL